MKESPRKVIKLNSMKPSILNRTEISVQKELPTPAARIPYSLQTKYNRDPSLSSSVGKPDTSSMINQALQPKNFQNRQTENERPKKVLRFELKCEDAQCDGDLQTLTLNGGYSFKSLEKKNGVHNHRKINQSTVYDYLEDNIPQILKGLQNLNVHKEPEADDESKKRFPYPRLGKVTWRQSPFAPLFGSKNPQAQSINLQRYVENEEIRQKRELQKYELEKEIELEKKKQKAANKKQFKTETRLQKNGKSFGNRLSGILESNEKKMKTRLQEKQEALSGFEVSNKPEPGNQGKFCYPCKIKFDDYWSHIQLPEHKLKLRKSMGTDYFEEEIQNMKNKNKQEINSQEYKYLIKLDKYLGRLVESLETILMKKKVLLSQKLRQIKVEVDEWAGY